MTNVRGYIMWPGQLACTSDANVFLALLLVFMAMLGPAYRPTDRQQNRKLSHTVVVDVQLSGHEHGPAAAKPRGFDVRCASEDFAADER